MGFTKKSLLALVLALVMVLGMAMPTALAASSEDNSQNLVFTDLNGAAPTDLASGSAPNAITTAYVGTTYKYSLNFGGAADAHRTPMTEAGLGHKPTYELWADNGLSASITDGVLSVTPQGVAVPGSTLSVKVKISLPADETSWPGVVAKNGDWTGAYYWEGTLKFAPIPTASYTPGSIVLDSGDAAKKVATISATDFATFPTTTNVVIADVTLKNSTGIATPSEIVAGVGGSWSVTASAAGDDTLVVELIINGYKNDGEGIYVEIPLHVGNANNEDYMLATNVPATGIVVERNQATGLNLTLSVRDKSGNPTRPVGTNRLANGVQTVQPSTAGGNITSNSPGGTTGTYVFTLVPDSGDDFQRDSGTTAGITFSAGSSFATTGLVDMNVPANLISFKGRVDVTYVPASSPQTPMHGAVLYTSFPLVIKPAPLTVSPSPVVIDLAKNDQGAIKNPTGVLTLASGSGKLVPGVRAGNGAAQYGTVFTLSSFPATLKLDDGATTPTLPAIGTNGYVTGTNYNFRFVVTGAIDLGTYEASVRSAVTPAGDTNTYWTETQKFKIQVIDTTPTPVFTPEPKSLDLDISTSGSINYEITNMLYALPTVHAFNLNGAFSGTGTLPTIESGWNAAIPTTGNSAGKGTFKVTAGSKPFNGTLTISGTVDGVKIADVKIPVTVAEQRVGKPHHFVATPNPISVKVGSPVTFTIDVYDYQNNLLGEYIPSVKNASNAMSSDATMFTVSNELGANNKTTNTWKVSGQNAGTGKITIEGITSTAGTGGNGTIDCSKAMPLIVPVTVEGIKMTANKTSLDYDLAIPAPDRKVAVQFTVDTTKTVTWTDLTVDTTPSGWINKGSANIINKGNGLFEFVLSNTAYVTTSPVTAKISGVRVDGFAVDPLTIPIVVTNSAKLIADKTEIALSPDEEGKKEGYVQISANPAHSSTNILAVTSAVSSNPAVATIELVTGVGNATASYIPAFASYKVKAVAAGETLLTFQGTSNGNALQPVSVKVTVGEATKPVLVVTPNPIVLDLTTNKDVTLAVTSSVAGTTVTDVKVTYTGTLVTVDGLKVTAALDGTGSLTVDGKIDGIAAATVTVPITVNKVPVITGDFLVNDAPGTTGSLFVRNSTANNQYKLTLNGYTGSVTWKSSNKAILKFIDAPAGKASSTKTGTEVQWVQVLKAGTVKVTATPATGTAKSITFTIKTEAETGFTVGDQALLVGQRASAKPEIVPATAKTKGFKFKSSDKKVVTVSSKGILVAKKAGTATITVTPKKKGLAKQTFTVTVTVDYKNLNYNSVVLLQNSDGKPNADADNVKKIFESAKFDASGNAAGANILAATATKADVKAAIATMALASKNTSDISNFYFAGAATKTGLTFTDGEYSYTDLANDLAKCTGNVVVFLDCTGGNRLINAKAASDADIFAAFSKAVKPGLSTMTNSAVEKLSFTVFTSTAKAKTTVTPTVSADGSSVQYKFTKLFAETLKVSDSNTISVGTNGIVNVKQLWAKLKAAKGSVWASKKSVMPIYGYVPAAPVTP